MSLQSVDPIAWVKASQARFFPGGRFDVTRLLAYVMADVLELGGGECKIVRRGSWWFIVSDVDWLKHELPLKELFQRVVPAPVHGEHSMRAEVLVMAYAEDVFTLKDGDELIVKGAAPDRETVDALALPGHRLLGFHAREA